jgi:glycosyltransferase involved in cell wall biosynthesis
MSLHPKVTVLQHRLLHYRVELFERIRSECERQGIEFHLVHGQPSRHEALRADTGSIAWADQVRNRWISVLGRDLLWQPFPRELRDSDLVVIMQESRILSNYALILKRYLGRTRIAYWGHGRNFQSEAPTGWRERWKSFWLTKVDWWFAYTNLTKKILIERGLPEEKITCLNNAIDNDRFIAELAGLSDEVRDAIARNIGLAPGSPLGVYCGSLYPDKRLDLLADAAERIHAAIPAFRLIVIGDGPSRPELEGRLAGRDWVRCVGVKNGSEKAAYFRLATVLLSPGAVGLHVLDAFCAGLPMFTTASAKHGPEIEYLEHLKNGFVISGGPEAYADAVISLLHDDASYAAVAAAAREAGREYTLDNMVRNFMQGIQACLGSDTARSVGRA